MKHKHKKQHTYHHGQDIQMQTSLLWVTVFIVGTLFLGISFFVWTLYPYAQTVRFVKNLQISLTGKPAVLINSKFSFEPYTHVQPAIRYMFISHLFSEYKDGKLSKDYVPLIKLAIEKMDETVAKTDNYPHHIALIAKSYDSLADLTPENAAEYHAIAEKYYTKAISLSPGNFNQDAKFAYAINLTNTGRVDQGVALMRQTVAYDTRSPEPHYFLGLVLFKQGDAHWVESLQEMEYSFDHGFDPGQGLAKRIYEAWLKHFYIKRDTKNVLLIVNRLAKLDTAQKSTYENIAKIITETNTIPVLNIGN